MTATVSRFEGRLAPCGTSRDGESFVTEDHQGLITEELQFACGCRSIDHEYHDGSISRKVIRHDGKVLVDELLGKE